MINQDKTTEKGFTLVEVLASIVIISILFLGIVQLLNFTNKTAVSNNAKLVSTHLAKATIERIKIKPDEFFPTDEIKTKTYDKSNCIPAHCEELFTFLVNDEVYDVYVKTSQNTEEYKLNLINVVVTIEQQNKNLTSTVEGYVVNETVE